MNKDKVIIVGGGLSAIYAFWGCMKYGIDPNDVEILRSDGKSMAGAVFLYECPIPFESDTVTSILIGTCDEYSQKQWGEIRTTSAHIRFLGGRNNVTSEKLYDPEKILPTLWSLIPNVKNVKLLTSEGLEILKAESKAVICTFSNPQVKQRYTDMGSIVSFPIYTNDSLCTDHTVIYNGLDFIPWIRQTIVPSGIYTEYPYTMNDEDVYTYEHDRGNVYGNIHRAFDLKPDTKPLSSEERREGNLLRVGRMATFDRSYLSHFARDEVARFLGDL